MKRCMVVGFLAGLCLAGAKEVAGQSGVIVDAGGTETRLLELTTSEKEFGGFDMGSSGIPIVIKEFLVGPQRGGGASYRRWSFTDDVEQLEIRAASPAAVSLRLRTGGVVSGSFGSVNPISLTFRGKSDFGDLSLEADKVTLVRIVGSGRPHSISLGTIGVKATITLRDGMILAAESLQRNVFFSSRYINVRGTDAHYASVWLRFKRGEASVETELPFSRIREIAFDAPIVTANSYSGGTLCKVTLRDGTSLSGECSGSETARGFSTLVGRTPEGIFEIVGDLGYAIRVISFAE